MENPRAPQKDDALVVTHYRRTPQQAALLGLEVTGSCQQGVRGRARPAVPALRETREQEQELKLLLVTPLQGEELGEKAVDPAEDLRNEVGDRSAALAVLGRLARAP